MGPVYRSAGVYRLAMSVLEGREGAARRRLIADAIPQGSSVLDLCCGDARIARDLERRGCSYTGLDINPTFVRAGHRRGLDVRAWDARTMDFPEADVVCMLSSLYHFVSRDRELLDRMVERANRLVVISEPTSNWATSGSSLLRRVARWLTRVQGESFTDRYSQDSLRALVGHLPEDRVDFIEHGRDAVILIRAEPVRSST